MFLGARQRPHGRPAPGLLRKPLGSARASLLLLLLALVIAVPTRGQYGVEVVAVAIVLCALVAPVEYAVAAVALGPLLPICLGALPGWYMGSFRWILVFLGLAILWLRFSRSVASGRRRSTFNQFIALFGVMTFVSALFSTSPTLSLFKWTVLAACFLAGPFSTRRVVADYGPAAAKRWNSAWVLLLSPFLIGNVAALLFGLGQTFQAGAFRGVAGNANSFGAFTTLVLPLLACRFVYSTRESSSRRQALMILTIAATYLLVRSWSRASLSAALVGLFVVWAVHPRNRFTAIVVLVALVTGLVFLSAPDRSMSELENWVYKGKSGERLVEARVEQWRRGYEAFVENPLLGAGFGITSRREESWTLDTFRALKREQGSSVWAILGQVGLLGGVPFYLGLVTLLIRSTLYARAVQDPWLTGVVGSVWAGFANAFFEGWMAAPSSGLFWIFFLQCFFLSAVMNQLRPPQRVRYVPASPRRGEMRMPGPVPAFGSVRPART